MASTTQCIASLARLSLAAPVRRTAISTIPSFLLPGAIPSSVRYASAIRAKRVKKKKTHKTYRSTDLRAMEQSSLCDAMRYLRAFEVGNPPSSVKYEIAVKFKSGKNGPVLRDRIKLPFAIKSDARIAVICPEDHPMRTEALDLGAVAVGEESIFESIRDGTYTFNKLICHADSEPALKAAGVARILGPKGLMPNRKFNTITFDIKKAMDDQVGATEYRERDRVVRVAIGQLGFTPKMLGDNLKVLMEKLKQDADSIADSGHIKMLEEVVLSTTHGPGFSLDGKLNPTEPGVEIEHLQSPM
ncbi:ribosomal protein L1-like protein [Podospora conica]|nr:ribosomal protein L1-like protein [Schizothecium conicum]